MKLKSIISVWSLRLFFVCILNCVFCEFGIASAKLEKMELEGYWHDDTRSITPSIPIHASINGPLLYIENTSPSHDITIKMMNSDGDIIYTQEVPAIKTSFIVIPLSELPAGVYQLELSNLLAGYLRGDFIIIE